MLSIQTNVNSLIAQQNLNINNEFQSKTIQQLTSGYRINQSGDDAAGLAVANQYRSSVAELTQGVANGNDGVAQLQIMDGGMSNISQILDRLKTLATQSASGTLTGGDATRQTLNGEFQTDLAEIDRQAQSIGLNTGGSFAKSLNVYLGQGSGSTSLQNGIVTLDLSKSAVDSQSLGMKGMDAVNATDIGSTSLTSVQSIVNNTSGTYGNQEAVAGYAALQFTGAGFSDAGKAQVSVNLAGVTDVTTLVAAVNAGIQAAGQGSTAAATAFANANIVASVHTDSNGGQELQFTSSTAAFQVQAGDQMGNALLGNVSMVGATGTFAGYAQGNAVTGTAATVVQGATTTAGTFASGQTVKMVVSGGGLASPVTLQVNTNANGANGVSTSAAITDLETQFKSNADLATAGLSMSGSSTVGGTLSFDSATGQGFSIQVTGDTQNLLGLGSFLAGGTGKVDSDYSTITTGASYQATTVTGNATTTGTAATLQISLNGQAATQLTPIDLTSGTTSLAYAVVGGAIAAGAVDVTGTNNVLNITVTNNGVADTQNITLANTATVLTSGAAVADGSGLAGGTWAQPLVLTSSNNQFQLSVDGAAATTITLGTGSYTSGSFLTAMQGAVGGLGATASYAGAAHTGALTITSNNSGLSSSVNVTQAFDPTAGTLTGSLQETAVTTGTPITLSANNDSFMVSRDGAPAVKVQLTDATYTNAGDLLTHIQSALDSTVGTGNVVASWGATGTGALTFTSATLGASSSVGVTAATYATKAAEASSTITVGTANTIAVNGSITTLTLSAADHNDKFTVSVDGGATKTVQVDGTFTAATGAGSLLLAINNALTSAGANNVSAAYASGGTGALTFTSTGANSGLSSSVTIGAASDVTAGSATSSTILGTGITTGTPLTVTAGSNSFDISLNGQSAVSVTVGTNAGSGYTSAGQFLTAVNAAINATSLDGLVSAGWDAVNGKLTFSTVGLGAGSSIQLSASGTDAGFTQFGLSGAVSTGSNAFANTGLTSLGIAAATHNGTTPNDGGLALLGLNGSPSTSQGQASVANTGTTLMFGSAAPGLFRGTNDSPTSLQTVATAIQNAFGNNAVVKLTNTNQLTITSATKGANSAVVINTAAANDASALLKLDSSDVVSIEPGQNMSIGEVVSNLNAQFASNGTYQAAGLTATATASNGVVDTVTPSNNVYINISSGNGTLFRVNSLGGTATMTHGSIASGLSSGNISNSTPLVISAGTNDQFKLAVDGNAAVTVTLGTGSFTQASGTGSFLSAVQAAIGATTLAGKVTAGWDTSTGDLTFTSASTYVGSASSVAVSAVSMNTGLAAIGFGAAGTGTGAQSAEDLGFGVNGSSFTAAALAGAGANTASTGTTMSMSDANGITTSGTFSFNAMQYGSDKQALTFSATNSSGGLETKTITLQNNAGAGGNRAGVSIDDAVAYINHQLQSSTSTPALQQIVAVKEVSGGKEVIDFMSKLSNFTVGVGSTPGDGSGLNGGLATYRSSTENGQAANMSVDTQANAEQAITAIKTAVSNLGSAQAAVGKGENQLSYAINLAQSQITNFSAAESQIRDANVAAQAANLSKGQVLQQSTIAAMAQANSAPQAVLSLLKG